MAEIVSTEVAVGLVQAGKVIAYPTEAVFGLGCDPRNEAAVLRLLAIKQRPVEKGLILIAADYSQLLPFVDDAAIPLERRAEIFSSWPGHISWVLPSSPAAPGWITGKHQCIAVRVSTHPVVRSLCQALGGPLVSTSANKAGEAAITVASEVLQQLGEDIAALVAGELGGAAQPSQIRDAINGQILRS
ncbi:Sua5/YciO/YrdC/YwlC family protein [Alkalimonas amylolytica]|uniref:Threonylcarbamoyl-AMP synthase n=1 Tax=Alkalimonas amylolytica TaxID=152573 RepID=A0A1H4D049_ALKAM|nr:Sua5/YciO/YrdC/YwlC family protein [Alkalimonas amylolytica]SEA66143.1 L-threonylcarbamoyladenylate synthase [Alkalimonas amylolytica]